MAKTQATKRKRRVPPILNLDAFMDLRRPRPHSATMACVPGYVAWYAKRDSFRDDCRKIADATPEGETPKFSSPPKAPSGLNKGRLTVKQYESWLADYNDDKPVEEVYTTYQPVDFQIAKDAGVVVIMSGKPSATPTKPKLWKDAYGDWNPGDHLRGPAKDADGKPLFAKQVRVNHARDVRRLVDGEDNENIVKIGKYDFAVGLGGEDGSVVKITSASERASYEAIDVQATFESLASVKGLANLVARINNEPMEVTLIDELHPIFFGRQVMTLGYFTSSGKTLTPAQVRKLATDGGTAKFEPIAENDPKMLGKAIGWKDLWKAIQIELGTEGMASIVARKGADGSKGDPQSRIATNAKTLLRVHPDNANCLKVAALQTHCVPYATVDADGNVSMGVAVGYRTNVDLNSTVNDAKREAKAAAPAPAPKVKAADPKEDAAKAKAKAKAAKAKAAKDKAAKDKAVEVAKAAKAAKDKAAKVTTSDAAALDEPPVEAATAPAAPVEPPDAISADVFEDSN